MNHKTGKIYILVLLTLAMMLSVIPLTVLAAPASPFAGGDGSPESPYQVADQTQLDAVRGYLNACFVQVNDITIDMADWTPIGSIATPLTGSYDGDSYNIKGLKINATASSDSPTVLGLFGVVGNNGIISNVHLEDVDIDATSGNGHFESFIGGLAGANLGTITGCSVTATLDVSAYDIAAGGLVGSVGGFQQIGYDPGTITDCTSDCILNVAVEYQTGHTGGLVGEVFTAGSSINNSISSGTVICMGDSDDNATGSTAGGLIGYAGGGNDTGVEIVNCGSSCAVYAIHARSQANAGGLIGCVFGKCIISDCTGAGDVEASGSTSSAGVQVDASGLIGWISSS